MRTAAAAKLVRYSKLALAVFVGLMCIRFVLFSKQTQRGPIKRIGCWLAPDSAENENEPHDTDPVDKKAVSGTPSANISSYESFDQFSISPAPCSNITPPFVLLIVFTRPDAFRRRETIRNTYGSLAINRHDGLVTCSQEPMSTTAVGFRLLFIIGQASSAVQAEIAEEVKSNGDIIQSEAFADGYQQATRKALALIHWSLLSCSQAAFVAKADDDCWLNPHLLLESLRDHLHHPPSILGVVFRHGTPIRDRSNRWAVTETEYPDTKFPPYVSGVLYVLHSAVLAPLAEASTKLRYLWHDDIFITGLAAREARIPHVKLDGYDISGRVRNWCCAKTFTMALHSVKDKTMWRLWNTTCIQYAVPC